MGTRPLWTALPLLALPLALALASVRSEGPVVRVAQGLLRGLALQRSANATLRTVYAFQGVPYARAPVGQRRFKDPEEPEVWSGIRNATAYGPHCVQRYIDVRNATGEEDCLYLNIFTADPPETWSTIRRPVIVFFHGGAFVQWHGDMVFSRPDPLLRKGIIFVSLNYRLGVMGFLNTEDPEAPGNAGLKDQNMALRWVQRNIAAFGGDPGNVTIMGESAGGASVHYHMMSALSRGLFQRAVAVSGSALAPWAYVERPRRYAVAMRRLFAAACADLAEYDIVPCLQRADARDLVLSEFDVTPQDDYENFFLKSRFVPAREGPQSGRDPFLAGVPERLMLDDLLARVPYVTGYVSGEGIIWIAFANLLNENDPSRWAEVDEHLEDIIRVHLPQGLRTRAAAAEVRRFYLGDRPLTDVPTNNGTLRRFTLMCGDIMNNLGQVRLAFMMSQPGGSVYLYEFARDGPIGFTKQDLDATAYPGVVHGDDMAYVLDFTSGGPEDSDPRPVPASEQPIRDRQANIIANFAKTGDPTPAGSGLLRWPQYDAEAPAAPNAPVAQRYLRMDAQLSVRSPGLGRRFAFWERLLRNRTSAQAP